VRVLFLTLGEVLSIHEEQILLFGGPSGLRDTGLLSSAMGNVAATFDGVFLHESVFEMAAAYLYGICRNHPFSMATSGPPRRLL
jgi:death-on-curing protein